MMTPAERLRDVPAAAKQRAIDEPISISAYRLDPNDDRFPKPVEIFMSAFAWGTLAIGAFVACYQIIIAFSGGH